MADGGGDSGGGDSPAGPGRAATVYVDGSGGDSPGFGYYVAETGETFYEKRQGITSNQAEYLAILAALKKLAGSGAAVTILSDSKNTVMQLNHSYAINNEALRELARQAWPLMAAMPGLKIEWVPRAKNLAGKMLGS